MNKKILLVDPVYNPKILPPNVSLKKIEAALDALGVDINIIDFTHAEDEPKTLADFRKTERSFLNRVTEAAKGVDLAYITTGHGNELKPYPVFPRIKACAAAIRKGNPKTVIVAGGALMNFYCSVNKVPVERIKQEGIDAVILGNEREKVLDEICRFMDLKCAPKDTVYTWKGWNREKYPDYLSLMYHVGCAYKCSFCFEGKIFDPAANTETMGSLIESLGTAKQKHGITKFLLEDSTLMPYKDFNGLMDRIQELDIRFAAYARISEIVNTPEKLKRMKEAGCTSLIVGIETMDNDILKEHRKNQEVSDTEEGLSLLKENEIAVQGCFMLGFPKDSLRNMEKTVEFAVAENMGGYRWHMYQPNYRNLDKDFFSKRPVEFEDHLKIQMNVPDHCLPEVIAESPAMMLMDEHCLTRACRYMTEYGFLDELGYKGKFTYKDVYELLRALPQNMVLNEERLNSFLF